MKQQPPAQPKKENIEESTAPKHPAMVEDLLSSPKISRGIQKLNDNFFRNVRAIVMTFVGIIFVGLVIFLYNNVYLSLVEANAIVVLRQEVATEKVDLEKHRNIKKFLESREGPQAVITENAPLLSESNSEAPPLSPSNIKLVQ
ncbi:MAG: hypothetical protein HOJ15_03480 [Candidatus Jacksonbacteria bacterium]|nr:hypothetical protein [Candidatus Jacksonbacteria bacterium]